MFSLIVFSAVIAAAFGAGQEVAVSQDTLGNYNFKYAIDGISRIEHGDSHGDVNGGFSYIDPYGILRKTEFTSGVHGYNAVGTDIPVPVQDTPEVAHAKANHLAALHAAYLIPRIPEFQGPEEGFVSPISHFRHFAPAPIAHFQHFAPSPVAPVSHFQNFVRAPLAPVAHHFGHFAPAPVHFGGHHSLNLPSLSQLFVSETPETLVPPAGHSFKTFQL